MLFTGTAATVIYNMGAGVLRAMGDSKRPLYFLVITCFSNIALDLLFVLVLNLGIRGVAIATVLSQCISALLVIICICRLPEDIRLKPSLAMVDPVLMRRILLIGLPAGLQLISFDLSNLLVQSGINSFGDITVAAWTAFSKADSITWMVSGAFGVSITTFVGQNFGAQKYSRIRQSVRVCLVMSIAVQLLLSTLALTFRHFILGIYTTDAEVIRVGAYAMLWITPFNAMFMFVEVFAGAMRGTGYSVMPTVITGSCVCVFRILWILTMVVRYHTIEMLCIVYPLSWLIASIVFIIAYLRGTWLHKRIEICGMEPEIKA
jgi:putative MATE family efflux protein